ncbi:unnamed protein product, partial [Prorocentrum cordatum]
APALRRVDGPDPAQEFDQGQLGPADGSTLGGAFRELAEESGLQLETPPGGRAKLGADTYSTGRGRRGGPGALKEVLRHRHRAAAGDKGRRRPREARTREARFITKRELRAAAVKGRFSLHAEEAPKLAKPKELELQPKHRSPAIEATGPEARARPKREALRGSAAGRRPRQSRRAIGVARAAAAAEARPAGRARHRRKRLPGRMGGAGARARREELRRQQGLGRRKRPRAASDNEGEATDAEPSAATLLDEVEAEPPRRAAGEAGRDAAVAGSRARGRDRGREGRDGSRDIFPLMHGRPGRFATGGRGRSLEAQRDDALAALHWLAGHDFATGAAVAEGMAGMGPWPPALNGLLERTQPPLDDEPAPSLQEAFRDLLQGRAAHECEPVSRALAPYRRDAASLPESVAERGLFTELRDARWHFATGMADGCFDRCNQWSLKAPHVELPTPEGLAGVEAESFEGGGAPAIMGVADVKDAFHRLILPEWLSRYSGPPDALAEDVGMVGQGIDGTVAVAGDSIVPSARALPTEFTWSLFFLFHRIGESLRQRMPAPRAPEPLRGRGRPDVLALSNGLHELRHCAHVDNLGAMGDSRSEVEHALADTAKVLESFGLLVRGEEARSDTAEALGVVLDGKLQRTSLTKKRHWRLHSARRHLLNRGSASGGELWAFLWLMPFLCSDWWPRWNRLASPSDASEWGYGVSTSLWSDEEVKAAGRTRERGHFRDARAAQEELPGEDFDGLGAAMASGEYEVNPGFPAAASAGLAHGRWVPRSTAEIGAGDSARGTELKGSSGCGSTAGKTPLANLDGEIAVLHRRRDRRARQAADPAHRDREQAARARGRGRAAGQAAGVAEPDRVISSGCSPELSRESGDDRPQAKSALGQAAGSAAADARGSADDRRLERLRERPFQRARPRRGARHGAANAETTGCAAGRSVDSAHSDKAAKIAAMTEPANITGGARPDPLKGTKGALLARAARWPSEADGIQTAADGGSLHLAPSPQAGRSDGGRITLKLKILSPATRRPTGRLREAARGHLDVRAERASARGPRRHLSLEGRYFADVFCGKGGCGRSAEFAGFPARYFDLVNSAKGDALRPEVMHGLIADIQAGKVQPSSAFRMQIDVD